MKHRRPRQSLISAVSRGRLFQLAGLSTGVLAAAALTAGALAAVGPADPATAIASTAAEALTALPPARVLDDQASSDLPRVVPTASALPAKSAAPSATATRAAISATPTSATPTSATATSARKPPVARPSSTRKPAPRPPVPEKTRKPVPVKTTPAAKTISYEFQLQSTYYYCAPAATRIALSARRHYVSQDEVANQLGTTTDGTDSAAQTTRVLNSVIGGSFYQTREIPGSAATGAERDRLLKDVVHAVSSGYAVVANIVGTAQDVDGGQHSFGGGHYLTVVGYRDNGRAVKIADPAEPAGDGSYWLTIEAMADWIAQRGYSA